jgi:hypothetical protein
LPTEQKAVILALYQFILPFAIIRHADNFACVLEGYVYPKSPPRIKSLSKLSFDTVQLYILDYYGFSINSTISSNIARSNPYEPITLEVLLKPYLEHPHGSHYYVYLYIATGKPVLNLSVFLYPKTSIPVAGSGRASQRITRRIYKLGAYTRTREVKNSTLTLDLS